MNSILITGPVKCGTLACLLLLPWALRAQDYSSTDTFSLSERGEARRVHSSLPQPLGVFVLEPFSTSSDEPQFKAKNVAYTYGREDRSPNVAAAFAMEINRHELKTEFAKRSAKFSPSLAWTNGEGTRGATVRESNVITPGLTFSTVPPSLNGSGGEVSVSLIALYGVTDQTDRSMAGGSVITTEKRQLNVVPGLKYLRHFKFKADPADAKHEFTFDSSYTRRETRSDSSNKAPTSSTYGFASFMAKFKFNINDEDALEFSGTWDIPVHEKQPAGQPHEGDGNSTFVIGYHWRIGKRIMASADYRQNVDDEFNDISRIQARFRYNF